MNSSLTPPALLLPPHIHAAAEMARLVKKEAHMTAFTALLTAASPPLAVPSRQKAQMKATRYGI